jgi:hypothetical protein
MNSSGVEENVARADVLLLEAHRGKSVEEKEEI